MEPRGPDIGRKSTSSYSFIIQQVSPSPSGETWRRPQSELRTSHFSEQHEGKMTQKAFPPGLPRPTIFHRQNSERRERLMPVAQFEERRALKHSLRHSHRALKHDEASLLLPTTTVLHPELATKWKRGLKGFVNGHETSAIADTGTMDNVVSEAFARKMKLPISSLCTPFQVGNSAPVDSMGTVSLDWFFSGESTQRQPILCHVLRGGVYDILLGLKFLTSTETLTRFKHRLKQCAFRVSSLLQFGFVGQDSQRLRGTLGNNLKVSALADTGAERNVMDLDFVLAQGFGIDTAPACLGYLQFADGSIQRTLGQTKASWTFENGETTVETFEVLENCITDVVLGEEVMYRHDVFDVHRSSLIYSKPHDTRLVLAPFDYAKRLKIFRKLGRDSSSTLQQGNSKTHADISTIERQRQDRWNYEYDFGRLASPQEREKLKFFVDGNSMSRTLDHPRTSRSLG